jgi:acyl-CoA thioesterase-2
MWSRPFHGPAGADAWLLNDLTSPSAQGACGLGLAHIYATDGTLVASVAQEGMIRLPATP